ncbi:hypothetical protein ACHWQZ_G009754 [Mnemiopsis leidyi]
MSESQNLLVCCTGSVAAIKIPSLIQLLSTSLPQLSIKLVATSRALHFFDPAAVPSSVELYTDKDEWETWHNIGDKVLHIELRRWADMMLIAPCDANTMAKMSNGICDNLLTCVVRAWDQNKPLLYCPAMNTAMWQHPITSKQTDLLQSWGYVRLGPISKVLACGDTGVGAMSEVPDIVSFVKDKLSYLS